jgi:hypothetical protein
MSVRVQLKHEDNLSQNNLRQNQSNPYKVLPI